MTSPTVWVVAPGNGRHGVVGYARRLAPCSGARFVDVPRPEVGRPWPPQVPFPRPSLLHLHYTDQLFGDGCDVAADRAVELAAAVAVPTVVTLHDVPEGDGTARDLRRADAYRRVAAVAGMVVVGSSQERDRLRRCGISGDATVVPLAWEPPPGRPPSPPPAGDPDLPGSFLPPNRHRIGGRGPLAAGPVVAVLGFVYPGKGHAELLAALTGVDLSVQLWCLGGASPGHDDLLTDLAGRAGERGRSFHATGYLSAAALADAARRADVPVCPQPAVSASASMASWIGAGRRPLVQANDYTRELVELAPGAATLYDDDDGLRGAVAAALADPHSTRLDRRPPSLSPRCIGARHAELYRQVAG